MSTKFFTNYYPTTIKETFSKTIKNFFIKNSKLIEVDGEPYLRRFYLKRSGVLPGLYIHRFYKGDEDRELHNHPWKFSVSLILKGEYTEERIVNGYIKYFKYKPGKINIIKANDFHRIIIDKNQNPVWTLFCSGKRVQEWGFLDIAKDKFIHWKEFEEEKRKKFVITDFDLN